VKKIFADQHKKHIIAKMLKIAEQVCDDFLIEVIILPE
jgi:hypothetical protein